MYMMMQWAMHIYKLFSTSSAVRLICMSWNFITVKCSLH